MKALIAALLFLTPAAAAAQADPAAPVDPRIQTIDYHPDRVILLQAAPGYQLTVELGAGERIESVAVGDSAAWQVTPNRRGDYLFVKPLQAVATNMTVVTDARVYLFELSPLYGPTGDMAYTVRFRFPAEDGTDTAVASAPINPQGRYRLSGARSVRPTGITDDGVHTYIEWAPEQALPAVYAVNAQGREALVNGMMRNDLFVIDSVVPRLVFRIDRHEARATRIAARSED